MSETQATGAAVNPAYEPKMIITALLAENLLKSSFVLQQIDTLKTSLRYRTDGAFISFDEMFLSLEKQVDDLPKLKLAPTVPTGTENQYIVQLITSLEQVLDDGDRVGQKVIHYEAKLKDAASQVKKLGSAFSVWYTLAASDVLVANYGGMVISMSQLKDLAASEFSRLMDNTDTMVNSLIAAVRATTERLKLHKKTQQDKFALGKDQANASWTSKFPAFGNTVSDSDATQLVDRGEDDPEEAEEPVDESPAFVSTTPKVGTTATWKDKKGDTVMAAVVNITDEKPEPKPLVYQKAANGGVETTDGTPVVRGDANGLPKLAISDAPITGIETFTGTPMKPYTVAVVPDEKFDALKAAVQSGPVDAKTFANLLSDEPVTVKKDKAPRAPKATSKLVYQLPETLHAQVVERAKDGQDEKIKCVVCDRRIRIGQNMFERDGGWAHAVLTDCTDVLAKVTATAQLPLQVDGPETVVDLPPQTVPLESKVIATGDISQDTIVAQMIAEHPVLATPNPTLAVKVAMNTPVSKDELENLIAKARTVVMTPEQQEEQRRSFAAGNIAIDSDRSYEEVRKDVDAAADAMAAAAPVANIPPRKRVPFLEDEGVI